MELRSVCDDLEIFESQDQRFLEGSNKTKDFYGQDLLNEQFIPCYLCTYNL